MNPFEQLFTQTSTSQVDPEVLEMLGRQASQLFQTKGIPLNQAITQVVANHPELGNEHIKRIVEFANTVTFQEIFQNSEDKNVHFDVADPGVILRDIKDGGTPAHDGKPLSRSMNDYATYPKAQQAGFQEMDNTLGQQFGSVGTGAGDMPKVASEADHLFHANPVDDLYDLKIKTEATRAALVESYEMYTNMLKSAQVDFYRKAKTEILDPDGAGLGGMIPVIEKIAGDLSWSILQPLVAGLIEEGVSDVDFDLSLKKTAGENVNLEHPIVGVVTAIVKIAEDLVVTGTAIDDLDESLKDIGQFFKTAGNLATGIKKAVDVKGKVPSGLRQRFPRD